MLDGVTVFCHSSIKIAKDMIIYFDPYNIDSEYKDADVIFITHDHFDHFDIESILKIKKDDTYIVVPKTLDETIRKTFDDEHVLSVDPGCCYNFNGIKFETVRAYNLNKEFHPKENNWVGYNVELSGYKYYVMGDTDETVESKTVSCDVLFAPVGGKFTMDRDEARHLTNIIGPKIAVPIHYGSVVGTVDDAYYYVNNLDSNIKGVILIK